KENHYNITKKNHRIYAKEKMSLVIIKDAAICLYAPSNNTYWKENEIGDIIYLNDYLTNSVIFTQSFLNTYRGGMGAGSNRGSVIGKEYYKVYISKTIDGELLELNKENLAPLVKSDPKMVELLNAPIFNGKHGNEFNKKTVAPLLEIVNSYNDSHKK
ncbi:MAG TPA: hypothetical protein VF411_08960, partial [Bacteroidia bacterium]